MDPKVNIVKVKFTQVSAYFLVVHEERTRPFIFCFAADDPASGVVLRVIGGVVVFLAGETWLTLQTGVKLLSNMPFCEAGDGGATARLLSLRVTLCSGYTDRCRYRSHKGWAL